MTNYKGRGRPRLTDTPHLVLRKEADRSHMTNITVSKELRDDLRTVALDLEENFGFHPHLGQTLTYLIRLHRQKDTRA